ncbi:CoA transferase [Yinghuangia sp. YIM S10712]|uniref:CoA transferase n=1 Tax=Yinghuangia sp. YIM S10712 TaxID=3436930 RepID=UPI003F5319DA
MTAPAGTAPLRGLEIVECATFVAGPSGCMALGQLGADVIRIDPIGGAADYNRWPLADSGASLYWAALNKGKRSIALDLRTPRGREIAVELATRPGPTRGLFVDNAVGRNRLTYEELCARRPDMIHLHIQGHADGRPAVDYTVNAEMGIPTITGPEDSAAPVNHVLPAWDLLAGMTATTGLLAALHRRSIDGEGAHMQLALADVAAAAVAGLGWLAEAEQRGTERRRLGNHLYGSFGSDFACGDGRRVMVVALTEGQWRALQNVTGTTEVFRALQDAIGADLDRESDRYELRETIAAVIRPWFAARPLSQVVKELDAAKVLWSPYRTMPEVAAEHRQTDALPVLAEVDQPGTGPMLSARGPLRWDGAYGDVAPAPLLGADTEEILAGLGLDGTEIAQLHDTGVVASAQT